VLVRLGAGVIERRAHAGIDAPREAELDQQIEGGIHRRDRGAGQLLADGVADLVGAGVVRASAELAQDHEALRGGTLSALV
jgi:hypothetical protein